MRRAKARPFVTLKLATSLDGMIATVTGESRWITGPEARAHTHLERSRHDGILVGRGTWDADRPSLDVRLAGLEARSPERLVLTTRAIELPDAQIVRGLSDLDRWQGQYLLVEGGAEAAAAFLRAGLVDRLLLYRAPILLGPGKAALGDIGLADLAAAHGRWRLTDARALGVDRLEEYERV